MARKKSTDVEYEVLDPLKDRILEQRLTYLAQDGRPITARKIEYLERVQRTMTGLFSEAVGINLLDIESERR